MLREDLEFTVQQFGGRVCYVIRDLTTSAFYQIGFAEYAFLSLLDGETTVQQALSKTSSRLGADAFTELDAAAICRWLLDHQLVESTASGRTRRWPRPVIELECRSVCLEPIRS